MSRRVQVIAVVMLAIAVPATAQTFGFSIGASAPLACLAIGNATYRVAQGSGDVTVRIDPAALAPDLRVEIATSADEADFVFVDDGNTPPTCRPLRSAVRNVKIDAGAVMPDLVVGLATAGVAADYRIYVNSRWLAPETVAALFAAAHAPARKLAGRVTIGSN